MSEKRCFLWLWERCFFQVSVVFFPSVGPCGVFYRCGHGVFISCFGCFLRLGLVFFTVESCKWCYLWLQMVFFQGVSRAGRASRTQAPLHKAVCKMASCQSPRRLDQLLKLCVVVATRGRPQRTTLKRLRQTKKTNETALRPCHGNGDGECEL